MECQGPTNIDNLIVVLEHSVRVKHGLQNPYETKMLLGRDRICRWLRSLGKIHGSVASGPTLQTVANASEDL